MKSKNTYILFVFVVHEDQDKFVSVLGEELSMLAMSPDVRYYYGDQSAVYVFTSNEDFKTLSEFVKILFAEEKISFMFLPLDKDNMTSGFGDKVDKHLFGSFPLTIKPTNISKIKKIQEELDDLINQDEDEDEDNEIEKLKSKPYVPSVNDILDKIKIKGMKSLTSEEKNILDNYSKQL